MEKAPESYLDQRRPPLDEAIRLEQQAGRGLLGTFEQAIEVLRQKGYFTPKPRPWKLGVRDRGMGRTDFGVLDKFGDLVAEMPSLEDAELVVEAVNALWAARGSSR